MNTFLRAVVFCWLMSWTCLAGALSGDAALQRGYDWLAAQLRADGSLAGEQASQAMAWQAQTETLQTLMLGGRDAGALVQRVRSAHSDNTELASRQLLALAAAGDSALTWPAELRGSVLPGGGYAAFPGEAASALDTAFALVALGAIGTGRDAGIAAALGFLGANATTAAHYSEGQPAYATAYALLALHRWRHDYALDDTISRTHAALLALQQGGVYPSLLENAVAAFALTSSGHEADAVAALQALRSAQAANGSWNDDPYLTAVALRALAARPDAATAATSLRGRVTDSAQRPLGGVRVSLSTTVNRTTETADDGGYALTGLAAGSVAVQLSKSGYRSLQQSIVLPESSVVTYSPVLFTDAETPPSDTVLRGRVVKASDLSAVVGAVISSGGHSASSNAQGRFSLDGLSAGSFSAQVDAGGYQGASVSGSLAPGINDVGDIALNADDDEQTSTLTGTVTSADSGHALSGVHVLVDGTERALSGSDGSYRIEAIDRLNFVLDFRAAGYQTQTLAVALTAHGEVTRDAALTATATGDEFQVLAWQVQPSRAKPGEPLSLSATISYRGEQQRDALVLLRIQDADGITRAVSCGAFGQPPLEHCQYGFTPGQEVAWSLQRPVDNLPAGRYQLALHVIEPGTISASLPLGSLLASAQTSVEVRAQLRISGSVNASPPVVLPISPSGVSLASTVRNTGNAAIPAGDARLQITARSSGETVLERTARLPELAISAMAELDFGRWTPTLSAEYELRVDAVNAAVQGHASGALVVGDAAQATFTVTPTEVADGDQLIAGHIAVTAVDNPTGEAADPLFALVREAATRGAAFVQAETTSFQQASGCDACHIQSQAMYGLTHINELANFDISSDVLRFFANVTTSSINENGSVDAHSPNTAIAQSVQALWGLSKHKSVGAIADRYRIAQFVLAKQATSSSGRHIPYDYRVGWYESLIATTAAATEGLAALHRDIGTRGLTGYVAYRSHNTLPARQYMPRLAANEQTLYSLAGGELLATPIGGGAAATVSSFGYVGDHVDMDIAPNGDVYWITSIPHLMRWRPGTVQAEFVRQSLPFTPTAISLGDDGEVYVATSDRRLLSLDMAGNETDVVPRDALSDAFVDMVRLSDGTFVGVSPAFRGLTSVRPDGRIEREDVGSAVRPSAIAEAPNGGFFVYGRTSFGWPTLVHLDREREVHRVDGIATYRGIIASNSRELFAVDGTDVIHRIAMSEARFDLDRIAEGIRATVSWQLEQPANSGFNGELAYGLVGLAEALPFVEDAGLRQVMQARITSIAEVLRSRQLPDGSWKSVEVSWFDSDTMSTAIVGNALDYLSPVPSDPVFRSSLEYILRAQNSDGSWPKASRYYSVPLAGTGYIMSYLPKAYSRLEGITVDLAIDLPANIELQSPVTAPMNTALAHGGVRHEFDLGRVASDNVDLVFSLLMKGLRPNEARPAAQAARLRFINSFTGEPATVPIAIPSVQVRNGFELLLELNGERFHAHEAVELRPTVKNLNANLGSGTLRYLIETQDGVAVAELSNRLFSGLVAGSELVLPQAWNTGTTLAGDYLARVQLYLPDHDLLDEASLPFVIAAGSVDGVLLSGQVSTDKAEYDPGQRVAILGRIRNESPNSGLTELTLNEQVRSPDGTVVFAEQASVAQMLPASTFDHTFTLPLGNAAPGEYRVEQQLMDAMGNVLDQRGASFRVRSSADTGIGLSGSLAAEPASLELGDSTSIRAGVVNQGNADVPGATISLAVLDPQAEQVLWLQDRIHDLSRDEPLSLVADWNSGSVAVGDYVAVLQVRIGDTVQTLAQTDLRVMEPQVDAELRLTAAANGRLLVLVSCKSSAGHAEDLACVATRVSFLQTLLSELHIDHQVVSTTADFRRHLRSGRFGTYWISGGAAKLTNPLAEEVREAVYRGESLMVDGAHDSRNHVLNEALGVRHVGQLSGNAHRLLVTGSAFTAAEMTVSGDAVRYRPTSAVVQGRFDLASGEPALLTHSFGRGASVLHGYDLIRALQDQPSESTRGLLTQSLQRLQPLPRSSLVGGESATVLAEVNNLAREAALQWQLRVPDSAQIEATDPEATQRFDQWAEWQFNVMEDERKSFMAKIRTPNRSGILGLEAELAHSTAGDRRVLARAQLHLSVVAGAELIEALTTDLVRLDLPSAEANARDRVIGLIQQAVTELALDRYESAIQTLLRSLDELTKIGSVSTAPYRIGIAQLIGVIERKWSLSNE